MNHVMVLGHISNVTNQQEYHFWMQTERGNFVMCHLPKFFHEGFDELQNNDTILVEGVINMMGRVNTTNGAAEGWVWVTQIQALKPAKRAKLANDKWKVAQQEQWEGQLQGADIIPRMRQAEQERFSLQYELNTVRREAADAILRAVAGDN